MVTGDERKLHLWSYCTKEGVCVVQMVHCTYQFCFSWQQCLRLLRSRNSWTSMIHYHRPLLEWIRRPVEQKRKRRNHTQRKRCLLCSWSLMKSLSDSVRKSIQTDGSLQANQPNVFAGSVAKRLLFGWTFTGLVHHEIKTGNWNA